MKDDYLQPDFYRFNEDSIKLVKKVLELSPHSETIIDLGAGSGIIGIELAKILTPSKITFLEIQEEFIPCLQRNCQELLPTDTNFEIINSSFSKFTPTNKYELIVCNPPYYLPGSGEAAKSPQRAIARSFDKDNWEILIELIKNLLSKQSRAFFIIKADLKLERLITNLVLFKNLKLKTHPSGHNLILEFALNID